MLQNSRRRCRGLLSWQVFLPEYRGPWRGHLEGNSDIDCAPVRTAYSFLRIRRVEKSSWRGQIGAALFPRTRLVGACQVRTFSRRSCTTVAAIYSNQPILRGSFLSQAKHSPAVAESRQGRCAFLA